MNFPQKTIFLALFVMTCCQLPATQLDSLKTVVYSAESTVTKWQALNELVSTIPWGTPDSTIKYCQMFLDEPSIENNQPYLANIHYYYGRGSRSKGNYSIALDHFKKSYEIYTTLVDSSNMAKAAYQLGIINLFSGKMETSLSFLTEALDLYKAVGTQSDIADMLNAMASYYTDNEQEDLAIEKYKEALAIYTALDETAGMANIHANLGLTYIDLEKYDLAETHILEQGRLDTIIGTDYVMGFHYDFMGYLYKSKGELLRALGWYQKALKVRKRAASHYNLCETHIGIGNLYNDLGQYGKAIPHLNEVLSYEEEHQSLNQLERAYTGLSTAYEAQGNHILALANYKKLKTTSDSIYNKKKISEIANMETAIKKTELDAEITLLNKENQIAELSLLQQKKFLGTSLLFSAIFLLLGLVMYRLYRKIKAQKIEIEITLKEKDILLREIHHRVKNNLQIISSVLSLQSRQIKDSSIQQAINEGRNRVRSMALIHQNLYQKENLTGVSVNGYLEKLIEELFNTYNISRELISLNLDIDNIDLDVDTMIPLGLIINELVSNSLKHAFKDNNYGYIKISLKEENKSLILNVEDNGIGVTAKEMATSNSFGNRLIKAFSQKLKADYTIEKNNGTKVTMTISKYLKAA